MRISRPQLFMEIAQVVAKRSTCARLNVGAVLVKGRSIVSIGYNGVPAGEDHCAGNDCPGMQSGCQRARHAEHNAMLHLPKLEWEVIRDGPRPLDLYVTDSPCPDCMNHIRPLVKRIFFAYPYRINEHLTEQHWCHVYRVLPSGHVMNWRTRKIEEVET